MTITREIITPEKADEYLKKNVRPDQRKSDLFISQTILNV